MCSTHARSGGELEKELAANLRIPPPITRLPSLIPVDPSAGIQPITRDSALLYDDRIIGISLSDLRNRLHLQVHRSPRQLLSGTS
jgi:hypothetical protein